MPSDPLRAPRVSAVPAAAKDDAYATLLLAFGADPMMRWSFASPPAYVRAAPQMFDAMGGRAFAHGTAFEAEGFSAAALWLPPGVMPDSERIGEIVTAHGDPALLAEGAAIGEQIAACRPSEPCWYLAFLGADPARTRRGLGAALLAHVLEGCDARGEPAYLESSNPRNISLYERHGFEIIGRVQAGSSPVLTPMLRLPR